MWQLGHENPENPKMSLVDGNLDFSDQSRFPIGTLDSFEEGFRSESGLVARCGCAQAKDLYVNVGLCP